MAHETCQVFSAQYGIFYWYPVNGSNNLTQSDSRPMQLCPACLRKLHAIAGFAPVERDRKLQEVYQPFGFTDEATWVQRRRQTVRGE
ncbi:MAG: hypothetical protein FJ302_01285 [Planctomycetes bacterium]|nr:hypothetical protein [Planctomycetota bacterium]